MALGQPQLIVSHRPKCDVRHCQADARWNLGLLSNGSDVHIFPSDKLNLCADHIITLLRSHIEHRSFRVKGSE